MGGRKGVPSSRYGTALAVMEGMHWTYDEYLAAPYDLIDELTTRIRKRTLAENRRAKAAQG